MSNLVQIIEDDLFNADLTQADIVTMFCCQKINELMMPLLKTMKPGSRIVTRFFPLPGIKVTQLTRPTGARPYPTLLLYTLPLKQKTKRRQRLGMKRKRHVIKDSTEIKVQKKV